MATRSPTQTHAYWGVFPTINLPASANVEVGDTAFDTTLGALVVCTAVGPVVWSAVGSPPVVTQVEVDFGALPSWGAEFALVVPAATGASRVNVWESGATATGRVGNDQAWDQLLLSAAPSLGQIVITAIPMPGPVVGRRVVCYQIF